MVDRLRETSPHGIVVRAGGAALRAEVADYIDGAIASPPRQVDPAVSRTRWARIAERVRSVLQEMHERDRIEAEIAQLNDRLQALALLPPAILLEAAEESELDAGELLDRTLADVRVALDAFGSRLGLFRRWVRHRERLEQARDMLRRLGALLDLAESEVEECLASVADRPRRSFSPRRDFGPVEERVWTLLEVLACRRNVQRSSSSSRRTAAEARARRPVGGALPGPGTGWAGVAGRAVGGASWANQPCVDVSARCDDRIRSRRGIRRRAIPRGGTWPTRRATARGRGSGAVFPRCDRTSATAQAWRTPGRAARRVPSRVQRTAHPRLLPGRS